MGSGMKVGWLVVGAVSVLSLLAILASGPATLTLLGDSPPTREEAKSGLAASQSPKQGVEAVQPTVVRLEEVGRTTVPPTECRPCSAVEVTPASGIELSEPPSGEGPDAWTRNATLPPLAENRTPNLLIPFGPVEQIAPGVPELAAPPVSLPDGLQRR